MTKWLTIIAIALGVYAAVIATANMHVLATLASAGRSPRQVTIVQLLGR